MLRRRLNMEGPAKKDSPFPGESRLELNTQCRKTGTYAIKASKRASTAGRLSANSLTERNLSAREDETSEGQIDLLGENSHAGRSARRCGSSLLITACLELPKHVKRGEEVVFGRSSNKTGERSSRPLDGGDRGGC